MDRFWASVLIFVIVVLGGASYVQKQYGPQKVAQEQLITQVNQTMTVVNASVDESAPTTVSATEVINTVNLYCKPGNTVDIIVDTGTPTTYTTSSTGITTKVNNLDDYYTKTVTKDAGGAITDIRFDLIS